ncbi:hypothetical protein ABW20_dc0103297 [Dactylellina cionopaga]|nr:hypothetical protein ABW20_dc0103297 [Dactylellina cionopaga]
MKKRSNIRNVSVIARVDHGKATLTDSLVAQAGIFVDEKPGKWNNEQERSVTTKSTAISLLGNIPEEDLSEIKETKASPANGTDFLINLIDSPQRVEFSPEVTTALRITDGALVVVDVVEGASLQTENVLRQALFERIKPVLCINKVDRCLFELQSSKEELYQSLSRNVENFNAIISIYQEYTVKVDCQVSPEKGNVAFASTDQGWAFTTRTFATRYAKKFGVHKDKMMEYLWGDNWFDSTTKKWVKTDPGAGIERGFNQFILDPIFKIVDLIKNHAYQEVFALAEKLEIEITKEEREQRDKPLLKSILRRYLPATDAILEMMIIHLPSPITAQSYRAELLYEGPNNDEAYNSIRDCNPDTDLMLYVSKMVPTSDKGRFYAFGRVFAGTVRSGVQVRIQGPNYVPGRKEDLFVKMIERTVLMMADRVEVIDSVPAGNIVGLVGVDQFLLKSGTLTTFEAAYNLKSMKFSVSPVVQVAVEVKNSSDLPKLVEGLKRLSKSDPCVLVSTSDAGDHIVAGASELHLETCLRNLEEDYAGISLSESSPVVRYFETVTVKTEKDALSKSANKHNRIFLRAEPLDEELCKAIDTGKISGNDDIKIRGRFLTENFGWDVTEARKIWAFGPNNNDPNIIVDTTKAVQYLHEIKDSVVSGFKWATKEGPICEEPMRSVRFNIMDVTLFSDAIHRGAGQILPTARRVICAALLMSKPNFMEPIYLVEIQLLESVVGVAISVLLKRGGQIISQNQLSDSKFCSLQAYLAVRSSFGFTKDLRAITSGQAIPQLVFSHWALMQLGSPLENNTQAHNIALDIRKRKGLEVEIPGVEKYYDKL